MSTQSFKGSDGMNNKILLLNNISKAYPGVQALDNVTLDFEKGEVHAIVGENGAGKSTLIKTIAGAVTPDEGEIVLDGSKFKKLSPLEAITNGVSVIYQEFNLFDSLTVAENIFIGEKSEGKAFVDFKMMNSEAVKIFGRFNVSLNPTAPVKELSPGQKQIVEISKAIHKKAKIIIMDEPTAPLSIAEVEKLFEIISELKENGITIIYISHRLDEIFRIADRVSVMRDGKYVTTKKIGDTDRTGLIGLMVGRELKGSYPVSEAEPSETALEVIKLYGNGAKDISFKVRRGEILGIAGLVGSGRTELIRVIFGAEKLERGEIFVLGKPRKITSPAKALDLGIGLIPEDRKEHGVFLTMSIAWNISISTIKSISKYGIVNRKSEKELAKSYGEMLRIRTPSLEQKVAHLSGGNQQKVVLAKALAAKTDILIFDEPTRGIDVGAREEIYHLMRQLANQGKAIIMVSSDMEELLGMSDRIIVMASGRITGELPKSEFSQQHILELASGN